MNKSPLIYMIVFLKLGLGIISIILCLNGDKIAANFLILGAVFIEGCSKTFIGSQELKSPVDREVNSITNMISFGLSPALGAWKSSLTYLGIAGYALLLVFVVCSVYQMARSNVKSWDSYYTGIPVIAAGSLLLLDNISVAQFDIHAKLSALFILLLSYLMVSSIRIKKF